ncbi:hypothetical protein PAXINDRAFT_69398, partial [Paxillus involutus ATCC 200175]
YCQVPTFGRDTIRCFTNNLSEMKQMAAHNFEDLLQCAIPVFEGLLPEPHNSAVLELLYHLCQWHGLAKLRMHTDNTLQLLDNTTQSLGNTIQKFEAVTCIVFSIHELKHEVQCQQCCQAATTPSSSTSSSALPSTNPSSTTCRAKTLNSCTYKLHALGDYTSTIRIFGMTDSYSTHSVSTL